MVPSGTDNVAVSHNKKLHSGNLSGGETTAGKSTHYHIMNSLRYTYEDNFVRGHLLNSRLGGMANEANLYPITQTANRHHSVEVEEFVIDAARRATVRNPINYSVDVVPQANQTANARVDFVCTAEYTDSTGNPETPRRYVKNEDGNITGIRIESSPTAKTSLSPITFVSYSS